VNGGTFERFLFTLAGFHAAHAEWPTRVVVPGGHHWDVVRDGLADAQFSRIRDAIRLEKGDELYAEDFEGRRFDYAGPVDTSALWAWLEGVT
jgi:hypothetical protein